jgi:hypothetical protein
MKIEPTMEKVGSGAVGAAGELIVQSRLLMRGWVAGNANSGGMMNAPAVDLFAAKGARTVRIAVKSTGPGSKDVQWSAPLGWTSLFKGDVRPDFVIFAWFHNRTRPDDCRIFVVPAGVVDNDVRKAHEHWHSHPKKDGSPRKPSPHVGIGWLGKDTPGNIAHAFAEKWKQYEDNWSLLEA